MSRSRLAPHLAQPFPILARRVLVGALTIMMLLGVHAIGVAHAEEYVFSIGMLVKVDQSTITLGFEDGTTETYRIGPATTFRSQNADERTLADLEVGNPVLIITVDGDPTAFTVVDGGPEGFHEAGPADIRGHEGPCGCGSDGPAEHPQT